MELRTPYADLLPPLTTDEFEALKASIALEGVRDPIAIDEEGNVLDGHNRLRIAPDAPTRTIAGLTPAEKRAFVFAANFARRNLSPDQKREATRRMKEVASALREENPSKNTQTTVAARLGVHQSTVARWLEDEARSNMQPHIASKPITEAPIPDARVKVSQKAKPLIAERVKSGETQAQVAADFGVSQRTISTIVKQEEKKEERLSTVVEPKPATGMYDVILADPPWRYDFAETENRAIENQYPTMNLEDIKNLKVPSAADAALFLWATAPKLPEAMAVMLAWGFTYRTCAVWDKEQMGMGYWFRVQHELLLVGVKGEFKPPGESGRQRSVIREKRGEHSRKPEMVYEMLERMFPAAHFLEMFARQNQRDRWAVWGNQA